MLTEVTSSGTSADAERSFLEDLCLVGEIEGPDVNGNWAVVGEAVMKETDRLAFEQIDLKETWADFKHDLAILKEAGVKTVYDSNKAPDPDDDYWVITLAAHTINA